MKKNNLIKKSEKKFSLTTFDLYKEVEGQYTTDFIKESKAVKIMEDEKKVEVAVALSSVKKIDILNQVHCDKILKIITVSDSEFAEFIGKIVERQKDVFEQKNVTSDFKLEDINSSAPVVNIINAICIEAIRKKVSDIHIQSEKDKVVVRFRLDGVLHNIRTLEKNIFDSLVSRIKVMSLLNVMENRLCQDGRMSVSSCGKIYDFRVSIVPSVTGQNIVLRLFDSKSDSLKICELGFSKSNLSKIKSALNFPNGMILVTGPTGSGKTTTLHAMLNEMDKEHLKIVTIEDPVEKIIDGVEQIQVNDEIGLTFSSILRRILRQDPDIIMIGEIRDKETAELAIRASLTGHLILSTVHTNDSVSTISRLKNLGVESYLIGSVLKMSIAQRLVRKVCLSCKGRGCKECEMTGYKGRTAVSEILCVDEKLSEMIESGFTVAELRKFIKDDFISLIEDAKQKVKDKITLKEECMREGLL